MVIFYMSDTPTLNEMQFADAVDLLGAEMVLLHSLDALEALRTVVSCLQEQDELPPPDVIADQVHKSSGTCGFLGCSAVHAQGRILETKIRAGVDASEYNNDELLSLIHDAKLEINARATR